MGKTLKNTKSFRRLKRRRKQRRTSKLKNKKKPWLKIRGPKILRNWMLISHI